MAYQTATTGDLENAQNIVISQFRYTAMHNTPCQNLIENFTLGQGEKSMTVPKAGEATAHALTDGVDLVEEEDIGMSYVSLTTAEVGLKFILTDKLLRQLNEDAYKIIGRQMGDAMSKKVDTDIIALFSALNTGTTLGADNLNLNMGFLSRCISFSVAHKFPNPIYVVHHPNALATAAINAAGVAPASVLMTHYYAGIISPEQEAYLRNFFAFNINGVNCFQDGNIAKIGSTDSGYGAVFSKSAMAKIQSQAPTTERERDASLRGWEVVMVSDYGVFELDDKYGAPMRYEVKDLVTTST